MRLRIEAGVRGSEMAPGKCIQKSPVNSMGKVEPGYVAVLSKSQCPGCQVGSEALSPVWFISTPFESRLRHSGC